MTTLITDNWKLITAFLCGIILAVVPVWIAVLWRRNKAIRKGRRGEKIVAKELASLKKRDFLVINDLMHTTNAGRTSQIDHVVISTRDN